MTFLLDTDVLSQLQKRKPDGRVVDWLSSRRSEELHISVLSVGEVRRGATNLRHRGDLPQALALERWVSDLRVMFGDRIVPVSLEIADAWGGQGMRSVPPPVDGLIAATAIVHGLTMVTRNTKHFGLTGVRVVNPFGG